ncbi:hypothetical protein LTR33_008047 [Friedmanniomyces endolithicus]|nr:hypothetical protein LTR33_008047 [Friedmanniomyces endolithicus]
MPKRSELGAGDLWRADERISKKKQATLSKQMAKADKAAGTVPNVLPERQSHQVAAKRFWGTYPQQLVPSHRFPRDAKSDRMIANGTAGYKVLLPGFWPIPFYKALLDLAEVEHSWRVAHGYIEAQYSLRRDEEGPNGDKADVEGFMTEDVVEALAEWRRENEEEVRAAAVAAAPAAVVVPVAVMYQCAAGREGR